MIITFTPNPVLDRTLTVPVIEFDEVLRAKSVRLDWGGKGFNVSRALKALGEESLAVAFAGGATGQRLEVGLRQLGIATDFIPIQGETRTNIVIAETEIDRHIKVNEAGPTVQPAELSLFWRQVQQLAQPGQLWVMAGSLPPGVSPDFYAQLICLLQTAGAVTFLDTSGEPLRLGCAAQPFLVKPNALEAAEATSLAVNDPDDALHAANRFLEQGVEVVALSMGADGLLLVSETHAVWAKPPAVDVGNPTGAGDALLAGIAYAWRAGLPLEEMARWGVASGTAAAMLDGVAVGSVVTVESLLSQVELTFVTQHEGV